MTATTSPAAPASPTSTPMTPFVPPNPAEPPFNFDVRREVVYPLAGDDGRTHYVTLSQDSEGVVRIRLSLFAFPPLRYNAVIFSRGDCAGIPTFGPADVVAQFPFTLDREGELVLTFFNTRAISLTPGAPGSVFDADGATLAIYRPGDSPDARAACGTLGLAPGAPATGSGVRSGGASPDLAVLAGGFALTAGAALLSPWLLNRKRRPR